MLNYNNIQDVPSKDLGIETILYRLLFCGNSRVFNYNKIQDVLSKDLGIETILYRDKVMQTYFYLSPKISIVSSQQREIAPYWSLLSVTYQIFCKKKIVSMLFGHIKTHTTSDITKSLPNILHETSLCDLNFDF